jgi:hypothetical protein
MKIDHICKRHNWLFGLSLGLLAAWTTAAVGAEQAPAVEKLPANAKVVHISAYPASIHLKHRYDYRQVLLTAELDTGERVDVTRLAKLDKPAALVKVSETGIIRPLADGTGELKFTLAGQSAVLPVKVTDLSKPYAVNFVRDVMPTMSKLGCNAGTCHGAQKGKNGFKLSLRGYDPLFDHRALTDDVRGRRFNRSSPDNSLMLLKPSGTVPHVGGAVMQPGEPAYDLLRAWIADGVKLDLKTPRVAKIEVFPQGPVVPLIGMKQQMAVVATYSDGLVRDVSSEAFVESSNTDVATVDKTGLVTTVRRGETAVLARFEGAYAATTLIIMGDRSGYAWKDVPTHNYIDTLVYEKLKKVKVLPSELCTDAEFMRRVYLDLIGLPPEPEALRAFLADKRPTKAKRDELIDKLVGNNEYVEHWTNKWADLLQVNRKFLGEKGAQAFRKWIQDAVKSNMPYNKFAHTILTASGSNIDNPPASYYKILREPGPAMENTTQLFLAIRFNCNKCHDHPFERWTQDQYYHLAAFFAQVGRTEDARFKNQKVGGSAVEGAVPLVEVISDVAAGEVKHDRTGAITPPAFPYTHKDLASAKATRREQLAHWITSKDNPYFAKSYANRLWSYLLGVGIIEPVDDIRAGNPASNPKLLDRLTQEFITSNFNTQQLIKTICKSRTYQHSIARNKWNEDDTINYAHAKARRLPAEVLYDAIHRATGSLSRLPGMPPGARAAEALDPTVQAPSGFLDLFGRPARESACECERSSGMMLGPVLNLVNGPVVGEALKDPQNRIAKLLAKEKDDQKVVEEMFLALLCRQPTAKELALGVKALQGSNQEYAEMVAHHNKLVAGLDAYVKQLPAKQTEWEKSFKNPVAWTVLDPASFKSAGGAMLTKQADKSILAAGKNPSPETYTITANATLAGITAIRLEVLPDASLPAKGPGRAPNGNFVLNEFSVTAAPQAEPAKAAKVELHNASATFSQESFPVAHAIDNNPATGWAIAPMFGKSQVAIFELKNPVGVAAGTTLTFTLDQKFAGKDHNIGRFRLSVTTAKPPVGINNLPDNISQILAVAPEKRTNDQKNVLTAYYRSLDQELGRLQNALAADFVPADARSLGAQDLAWALLNSPAFLFNH